jgi:hypothetical protein
MVNRLLEDLFIIILLLLLPDFLLKALGIYGYVYEVIKERMQRNDQN